MKILEAYRLAASLNTGCVHFDGRPAIEHLSRVFLRVHQAGGDRDQQIAALLYNAIARGLVCGDELVNKGVPRAAVAIVEAMKPCAGQGTNEHLQELARRDRFVLVARCALQDMVEDLPGGIRQLALVKDQYARKLALLISFVNADCVGSSEPVAG